MKSILYVGATLIIGASIYGFADYKKTSRNKEFTGLYDTKEAEATVKMDEKKEPVFIKVEKTIPEKKIVKRSAVKKEEVIVVKTIAKELTAPVEKITPEKPAVNTGSLTSNGAEEKYRKAKKKKLNYKMFSRGSMEERYIEPRKAKIKQQ